MKIKEFWNTVCEEMEFRFFTGEPSENFKIFFETMKPSMLHYIPSINYKIALGLVSGAYLSGIRSALFIETDHLILIKDELTTFNKQYKIPILIITGGNADLLGLKQFSLEELSKINEYLFKKAHIPCVLNINKGEVV